ncbi:serine/threonine protein kinase [Calothrix sp. NIES-4071]|nr:serine/threonine protein kinase [Calothrix sp. NIES-4071]BAZ55351.1 serine/threonine protein kinase [Calothrix sp. NIES-4105]
MRCLNCHLEEITASTQICPRCNVHLPSLMHDVLSPGTVIHQGTYRIDYALGRGGFGITYQAVHTTLEKRVAIKEYYPQEHALRDTSTGNLIVPTAKKDIYERGLSRFVTEGKILAKINHPNVVRVENFFEERGTAYLVMELIDGYTLREKLNRQPNKKLTNGIEVIISALVDALATVHAQGIYHLDIKPDNVLLTSDNRLVLVDFGASRQGLNNCTTSQAFTLDYAPPEVLMGKDFGIESDIFELGMMLHEMIVGELPPRAIDRIFNDNWQENLHPDLIEPWKSLIISALQLQKHTRPPNVKQWWRLPQTQTLHQTLQTYCHACNASNPKTHKFCTSCGTPLQVAISTNKQPEQQNYSEVHPDDWTKTQKKGFFKFLGSLLDDN